MINVYVGLELPVNVAIDYNLVPRPLPTKAARQLEKERMVREVQRALQAWYYETYC